MQFSWSCLAEQFRVIIVCSQCNISHYISDYRIPSFKYNKSANMRNFSSMTLTLPRLNSNRLIKRINHALNNYDASHCLRENAIGV